MYNKLCTQIKLMNSIRMTSETLIGSMPAAGDVVWPRDKLWSVIL